MDSYTPAIGVTMGDPAGIGPEVTLKALTYPEIKKKCRPVVIGDLRLLSKAAKRLSLKPQLRPVDSPGKTRAGEGIEVVSMTRLEDIKPGAPGKEAGRASGLYIGKAVDLALSGKIDALVTAPINKESFNSGGYPYPGHTEFLAGLTKTKNFAMMLMGPKLKVILLTAHCALRDVSGRLSVRETLRIIELTSRSLKLYFGLNKVRLALAALNPHASEGGLFGDEESAILGPAAAAARKKGVDISGPLPSDALFYYAARGKYDAVICPYHDQGLIPLKLLHFENGVNVTLGLPIIRTSPDHGTAYDIAGKGTANPESMKAAIMTAVDMVKAKKLF